MRPYVKGTFFHRQAVLVKRVNQIVSRLITDTPMDKAYALVLSFTGQTVKNTVSLPAELNRLKAALNLDGLLTKYPMLAWVTSYYRSDTGLDTTVALYIKDQDRMAEVS